MNDSTKNKSKKIFKGAVFGVACALTLTAIPFASLTSLNSVPEGATLTSESSTPRIEIENGATTVVRGQDFTLPTAKYSNGEKSDITISDNNTEGTSTQGIKTDISVQYKPSKVDVDITGGKFTASNVGTYVITYEVNDNGHTYSYDYEVTSTASKASFSFPDVNEKIFPSKYDISLFPDYTEGAEENLYKEVVLPLPTLLDENGDKYQISSPDGTKKDIKFVTNKSEANGDTEYVLISVDGLAINKRTDDDTSKDEFFIKGSDIVKNGVKDYTISYTYYQTDSKSAPIFVAKTTKELSVVKDYYKLSSEDGAGAGYQLTASLASAKPDKASTGVKVALPKVNGRVSSDNTHASEAVEVKYEITVKRKDKSTESYSIPVDSSCIDYENSTFTAPEDGDYMFSYKVYDFYYDANDATKAKQHCVESDALNFIIYDVKDDVAPVVTIYDGSEKVAQDEDGKFDFTSARDKFNSKTANRNFIIYAIGVNDNSLDKEEKDPVTAAKNAGITLKREIRDNADYTVMTITGYEKYNLIFNWGKSTENSEEEQFMVDNPTVALRYAAEEADYKQKNDSDNVKAIRAWLKDNNYLIVTHDQEKKDTPAEELIAEGYAFVDNMRTDSAGETKAYTFTAQTYSIHYLAEDKASNKSEAADANGGYISMYISDSSYQDQVLPVLTTTSSFKDIYLPNETFTFTDPSVSDRDSSNTGDSRLTTVVAYRYLNNRNEAIQVTGEQKLSFLLNDKSSEAIPEGKWYKSGSKAVAEKYTLVTGEHFIIPTKNSSGEYRVDLTQKPESTAYVEIFMYTVDDAGNMAFYDKVSKVATTTDTEAPTLLTDEITKPEINDVIQGQKVSLPTLVYTDNYVEYMTHSVEVYYTTGGEKELVASQNSSSSIRKSQKRYVVNAGTFTASYAGDYTAVVKVRDAGNNTIATFFDYHVDGPVSVEDIVVENISDETITMEAGQENPITLETPTLRITGNSSVGFVGYDESDGTKKATDYTIVMVSAEGAYELTQYSFTSNNPGKYELKYRVFLIQYNTAAVTSDKQNGKLQLDNSDEDGITRLVYTSKAGTEYYVFVDDVPADSAESGTTPPIKVVKKNSTVSGTPESQDSIVTEINNNKELGVKVYVRETDVQKIQVNDTLAPELVIDYSNYKDRDTKNENKAESLTTANMIKLERISAFDKSARGIDSSESKVEVKVTTHGTGSALESNIYETVQMDKWDTTATTPTELLKREGNELYLKLVHDGTYTITYTVKDYYNHTLTKEYSFKVGDASKPVIDIVDEKQLLGGKSADEFFIGDTLTLDPSAIKLTDYGHEEDEEYLKEQMIITVKNGDVDATKNGNIANSYILDKTGTYTITITTKDRVGWSQTNDTIKITVKSKSSEVNENVYKTVGTILIVISAVLLVGVIAYFIISKVKTDRELKGITKKGKKK